MKKLIKKILFGYKADKYTFVEHLRKVGAQVGARVEIFDPRSTIIDITRPWLIQIGDDVQITSGVKILTHGYDWSVIKGKYKKVFGSAGAVVIGNNVFIGMNAVILKGVHIGDNVIIGAGSVVNKNLESNWVYAGNPAKPIMKIEDYFEKREKRQLQEAEELYFYYKKRFNREPNEDIFNEFFWLFSKGENLKPSFERKMRLLGNYDESMRLLKNNQPSFNGYNEFLKYLQKRYEEKFEI